MKTQNHIDTEKPIYIIPKNFDFKPKLFGIIEYKFGMFMLGLAYITLLILKYLNISIMHKIQIFCILIVTFFILSLFNLENENFFDTIFIIFNYMIKDKVIFYEK